MGRRAPPHGDAGAEKPAKASWGFHEGDEIAPGRVALKRLGGGYRYQTYLAWDDRLFSIVVAKIVRPDQVEDPVALRSLAAEASSLDRLAHPMLVRAFDAVLDGPKPHLILEFLEGPALRSLVKKHGPLSLEQILPLAVDLCSALHYMETEEMVHLDVKPLNVIMGPAPKLVDLSLARSIEEARRLDEPVGTKVYMAPEQHQPGVRGEVGPPADVWGLGITVYEAIAGYRPFPDPKGERPELPFPPRPLPKEIPSVISETLMHCLTPDPVDRPSAARLAMSLAPAVEAIGKRRVIRRARPRLG